MGKQRPKAKKVHRMNEVPTGQGKSMDLLRCRFCKEWLEDCECGGESNYFLQPDGAWHPQPSYSMCGTEVNGTSTRVLRNKVTGEYVEVVTELAFLPMNAKSMKLWEEGAPLRHPEETRFHFGVVRAGNQLWAAAFPEDEPTAEQLTAEYEFADEVGRRGVVNTDI